MNYLDDIPPRYTPPQLSRRQFMTEEETLKELNNEGREVVAEDFSDSKFLDN